MISNRIQNTDTGIQNARNSSSKFLTGINSSQSGNTTTGLEKGQLIRGEVTDLHNNEITVKLEDGRTLTGKLEGTNDLSIGDKVLFRVEDVSLKNLTLKIIPNSSYTSAENAIDKALMEASLARNERNREIVRELLNQQMSIDKQTISLIIKQSVLHKDTPIQTLVLMNKYHIPVTEASIEQFHAYENSKQSILDSLNVIADSVTGLFVPSEEASFENYLRESSELIKLLLNSGTSQAATESVPDGNSESALKFNNAYGNEKAPTDFQAPQTVGNLLSQEERKSLAELLKSNPMLENLLGKDFIASVSDGTMDIITASHTLNQILNSAGESDSFPELLKKLTSSPSMQKILTAAENMGKYTYQPSIAMTLSASDRIRLYNSLERLISDLNASGQHEPLFMLKERIISGNITSGEILNWISSKLNKAGEESVKNLLSSKEFRMLVKDNLLSQWALNPKDLTKNESIEKHFENLLNQLNHWKELADKIFGEKGNDLTEQVNQFNSNMDFIQNLNQIFTYIPLPLKFKNQFTDGELYVFSRKKPGGTIGDGIRVLLHLNMEHLGPLDIYLDLKDQHLTSKFYLEDESAMNIISSNLYQLEEVLKKKGYILNTEVFKRKKEVNIIEDILKADTQASSMTRYRFDLRA